MKTLLKENKTILFWFILGGLYYFFVKYMSLSLSEGDIGAAKKANTFLFYTLSWLLLSIVVRRYFLPDRYVSVLDKLLYPAYFLLLIGFGVYRNL